MKNVAAPRKFAPNPSEEMWMLAFPVGNKRKNQPAGRQKNYCYVCVAELSQRLSFVLQMCVRAGRYTWRDVRDTLFCWRRFSY
jgi:hypothetical protein